VDALETVRRRLVTQRLAGGAFAGVAEAVRWLGAIQAQEFEEAKWSLAERTDVHADADVEAAFARGDIVRTHVLRPTWHFAAREDVRWLLRVTRPRVHALNRYYYGRLELDAGTLVRSHAVLARALADGEALTRRELAGRLAAGGIEAVGVRLAYVLMHAELEEVICSGPRRGKQHTYALLDRRAPASPLDDRSRERALAELALRYFRSHGPATIRDFTAWSSLTVAETKAALDDLGGELERSQDEAGTLWYSAPSPGAAAPASAPGAFLIPMYDETIVAYKDLRVVLAHPPPRPGLLDRAIVVDGYTLGSWKRTLARDSATVEATLFGQLSAGQAEALGGAVERFGRFLGLPASLETRPPA
jgi:Winged helix DNA-binding domain